MFADLKSLAMQLLYNSGGYAALIININERRCTYGDFNTS